VYGADFKDKINELATNKKNQNKTSRERERDSEELVS
jgi:hypothetical protein